MKWYQINIWLKINKSWIKRATKTKNQIIWRILSIQMKEVQCHWQLIILVASLAHFNLIYNKKTNRKLKTIPTTPINLEIKFSKMKISTIYKIKKVQASLHINTSRIHLKKLLSLPKKLTKNNIRAKNIPKVK